ARRRAGGGPRRGLRARARARLRGARAAARKGAAPVGGVGRAAHARRRATAAFGPWPGARRPRRADDRSAGGRGRRPPRGPVGSAVLPHAVRATTAMSELALAAFAA